MAQDGAFVVLDVGTTQLKASWFSAAGQRLARASRELHLHAPTPGVAEQSPDELWTTACDALRESRTQTKATPLALSVTSERSTVFLSDGSGKPLTPALTWLDQRSGPRAKALGAKIMGRVGLNKIDHLHEHQRKHWNATGTRIQVPHSFLIHRLSGVHATDVVNAMFIGARADRRYEPDVLGELEIDEARLPKVLRGSDRVGQLTADAAAKTGLPARLPIVCGSGDQQCGSLGLGVHRPGTVKVTTGTGTFVNAPVEEAPFDFFDENMKLFCTPRATGDGALLEAVLPGTGSVYRWFRDAFLSQDTTFQAMDKEAALAPAGSHGVHFFPLFPFSLASFQRLGFHVRRAHFLRSILEGSAYGARFFLEVMAELGVKAHGALPIDGGGAASPLWRQIIADVTRRPTAAPADVDDAAAKGAAILASVATQMHATADAAIAAMVRLQSPLSPDPKAADAYDAEYPGWQSGFFTAAAGVEV